jgi:serine/threonine protein kinase
MISLYSEEEPHHVRRPHAPFEIKGDPADGDKLADRYQMLEELGSGSFGVVYKAIEKATGEIVAIKHVRLVESFPHCS